MPALNSKPRKILTLQDRINVIKDSEKLGLSGQKLATKYGCGKTQICDILKNKRKWQDDYEANINSKRQRIGARPHKEAFEDELYEWFCKTRSRGLPVSGPILQQKARDMAAAAGITDFKASNGWLDRFKKYHNICAKVVSGERGDVSLGKSKFSYSFKLLTMQCGGSLIIMAGGCEINII